MQSTDQPIELRVDCAKAAAPYVHAKLQSIDITAEEDRTLRIEFVDFSKRALTAAPAQAISDAAFTPSLPLASVIGDDEEEAD